MISGPCINHIPVHTKRLYFIAFSEGSGIVGKIASRVPRHISYDMQVLFR